MIFPKNKKKTMFYLKVLLKMNSFRELHGFKANRQRLKGKKKKNQVFLF